MNKLTLTALLLLFSSVLFAQSVIYVDPGASGNEDGSSWTDAYTSLDSAIAHYSTGDSIWMTAGVYKPDDAGTSSNITLPNGAKIYGSFAGTESHIDDRDIAANQSYFDGDIGTNGTSTDNSRQVLFLSNNTSQVVVDGFVIRNGYAYIIGGSITVGGGGARISNGKIKFENCEFSDNYTYMRGGALAIYGSSSSVELINCVFKNNLSNAGTSSSLGGAIFCNAGSLRITKCDFRNNTAKQGGAISSFQPSIYIDRTAFSGNKAANGRGGAIDNGSESSLYVYNSLFVGNYAHTTGAAIYTSSSLNTKLQRFAGCTFAHNWNNSSSTNYTVYGSDYTSVYNCIVYGNHATKQLYNLPPAIEPTIKNCLLEDTITIGSGIIYGDPGFVSPATGASSTPFDLGSYNYNLSSSSPAVNQGNNTYVYGSYNIALNEVNRIIGGTTDIGAYESPFVTYMVNVLLEDENAGTVTGGGQYFKDSAVTLTATASSLCYSFSHWEEDDTLFSNLATVSTTATGDRTFTAIFTQAMDTVTTTSDPVAGGSTSGDGIFACSVDSVRSFVATAAGCYNFVKWTKDGNTVSTDETYSTTVTESMDLVAHFEYAEYTVDATAAHNGAGVVSGGGTYKCDSTVVLTATTNDCYEFDSWKDAAGNILGTDTFLTFNIDRNHTIKAYYKQITYAINVVVDPVAGGSVSGDGNADCGSTVTLKAIRKTNYLFAGWEEDGSVFSTNETYQFTAEEDRNLKAKFSYSGSVGKLLSTDVLVYPNPATDKITVESPVAIKSVKCFNVQGRQVFPLIATTSTKELILHINALSSGVYSLRIETQQGVVYKGFSK